MIPHPAFKAAEETHLIQGQESQAHRARRGLGVIDVGSPSFLHCFRSIEEGITELWSEISTELDCEAKKREYSPSSVQPDDRSDNGAILVQCARNLGFCE